MESTFDKFITNNPKQKALFDKGYNDFLLSEFILEKYGREKSFCSSFGKESSCVSYSYS